MAWQDVVFQYDGSFDGFLCCVFESYVHKEFPIAFYSDEECFSLYSVRSILTVPEHARRVYRGIFKRSKRAAELLHRAFLTCMEDKELHLYTFVRKLMDEGPDFLRNQSDAAYYPVAKALRHMSGELEKLRGFIRFPSTVACWERKSSQKSSPPPAAKPLLRSLCQRILFIYDSTHKDLLLYSSGRSRMMRVDSLQLALPGEEELCFRALWKRFYETVAIRERENPRCQNTFLPKRYRGTMTEFLPLDYERQQQNLPSSHNVANGAIIRMIDSIELPPTTSLPEHSI